MKIAIRYPVPEDQRVEGHDASTASTAEVWMKCPACGTFHMLPIPEIDARLMDPDAPTTGNFKITRPDSDEQCCFSIDEGKIKYTQYSTHHMAGQEADLPELQPEDFDG